MSNEANEQNQEQEKEDVKENETETKQENAQSFEFQSEVKQLLHILVYSLYKNKEVFLRELISNAVDALNKVQFEILTDHAVEDKELELKIDISFDKKHNKLIIEDTGIGMTHDELVANIGTIAHSGTLEYLKKIAEEESKKTGAPDLIGKFGVGFYSSFMVAKEIHIHTKSFRAGGGSWVWKSDGESNYTIAAGDKASRGTRIELFLKKDEKEFLEKYRIQGIIRKHSKFVPFPINVDGEKVERVEAIWSQPKSKLAEKEYVEFFKFFENTQEEPETYLHLSSDAPVQFHALLYVPKTSFEAMGFTKIEPGVDLYCRKVLIQKGSKDLMPEYLRFVKGVIDSEEIPLNISRETIQNNIKIDKIRKHVLKKFFEHLEGLKKKDMEHYLALWKNFHKNIKEGVIGDYEHREKLSELLLFHSSKSGKENWTDLKTYVEGMPEGQQEIYYVSGADWDALERNPALEAFRKKAFEVLYLLDPMDEFVVDHLREFGGKKFKMVESADIEIEKTNENQDQDYIRDVESFIAYLKTVYGERIADVKISKRLEQSPCLLAHASDGPSVQMEKIMKMVNKEYRFSKRIFEINPDHGLIRHMVGVHKKNPAADELKALALQLLDNMMLREGVADDVENTIDRMQQIMMLAAEKMDI